MAGETQPYSTLGRTKSPINGPLAPGGYRCNLSGRPKAKGKGPSLRDFAEPLSLWL